MKVNGQTSSVKNVMSLSDEQVGTEVPCYGFKEDDTKKDDGINNNINLQTISPVMRHKKWLLF